MGIQLKIKIIIIIISVPLKESIISSKESLFFTRKYYDIKQVSFIFSKESNKVPNGLP